MPTALFNTDIVAIADRPPATTLIDSDIVISSITATGNLAPITKANLKATLGINANSADIVTLYGDVSTLDTRVDDILVGQDLDPNKDTELLASRGIFPSLPDRLDDSDLEIATLKDTDIVAGSVLKSIKDNAENATFTPTVPSGIASITLETALVEVGTDVEGLKTTKESITNVNALKGVGWVDENLVDHEKRIVNLEKFNLNSWEDVQAITREGLIGAYLTVGDQLVATYGGVKKIWDVIGIDHDIPTNTSLTHSLTIQAHECLFDCQFDAPEPSNPDADRISDGNNRYIYSGIRQVLNSSDASFTWVSQHAYDAISSYSGAGFLYNLDPDLVAVLGAVNKRVAQATYDGGGQDTFSDKVFLLSRVETDFGAEGVTTGESVYAFYDGATDAEKIKLLSGAARYWWLRSPGVGYTAITRTVYPGGVVYGGSAYYAYGLSPACVIV